MGKAVDFKLKIFNRTKKKISLERFIYSLGIRHIGQENAKLIASHLKSSANFIKFKEIKNIETLLHIDGIGETQINSIKNFFLNKKNVKFLLDLHKMLSISNIVQINKNGLLKNKTFMLTGKLNGISRAEAKSLIEINSGKIISSVNKKLDFLIKGEKPTIKKINSAKDFGVKIINQHEWMKMLNKTS